VRFGRRADKTDGDATRACTASAGPSWAGLFARSKTFIWEDHR
jgi:hypothetical protein